MRLIKALVILIAYLGAASVSLAEQKAHAAESCTPIDLSAALGEARSQGEASWCYAYAASDLVSYYVKQKASAADIAIRETRRIRKKEDILDTNGGVLRKAVKHTFQTGICLESQLPSLPMKLQEELDKDETGNEFWAKIDAACANRLQVPMPKIESKNLEEFFLIRKIDHALEDNNVIGVGIDSDIFETTAISSKKIDHDVVVVGRRWNEDQERCEYKIRNSWGMKCHESYRESMDCKDGHLWLTENSLRKSGRGFVLVTDPSAK